MKNEADLDRKKIQGEFYESLTVAELAEWWELAKMYPGDWETPHKIWTAKYPGGGE